MRHRLFRLAGILAGLLVAAPLTGCSPSQVYGCTAVSLSVRDTPVAAITDDLPLTAALTADGRPLPGQQLDFWLYDTGLGQPAGAGVYVGTKSTGPDGVARLTLAGGPAAQLLTGAVPTGFGAHKPQRKDYCGATAKARLRCGTAPSAACPPVRKPTD